MGLPFTEQQFLDVFAQYNRTLGGAAALLWFATAASTALLFRRSPSSGRIVSIVLFVQWLWAGIAYHLLFFARINPAAYLFGALFVVEAVLILGLGFHSRQLGFSPTIWRITGMVFIVYSLIYPALVLLSGLRYPAMPTFGVPCPTTIFTVGVILSTEPVVPRVTRIIPFLWCLIAGSSAVLFGVYPDLILLIGAVTLIAHEVGSHRSARLRSPAPMER